MSDATILASTATSIARQVREGSLRAVDVARAHLSHIASREPTVGAFLRVDAEGALAAAHTIDDILVSERARVAPDELARRFPLAGVVVGVKDAFATRGLRTTSGSRALENWVPPYDATVVERVRRAGGVVVGKCNMDEFAMGSSTENSAYHVTRNPWDHARAPGGSSGGSAAAVASGMARVALGSDTGGSVRQPASFTGVVGFKPTYGRVSRYGLIAFASSLDVVGSFGATVEDAALLHGAVSGHDPRDATSLPDGARTANDASKLATPSSLAGLRVGIPREYFANGIDPAVRDVVRTAIARLEEKGALVAECSLPHTRFGIAAYYVLAPAEASSNLARYDGVRYGLRRTNGVGSLEDMYGATRDAAFGAEVKRRILLGTFALSEGYFDAFYAKAQRVRTRIRQDFTAAFERFDVLATPTSPCVAFPLDSRTADPMAMYLSDVCTLPASLAGVPAISVPCGLAEGLPVGLQLIAPALGDDDLLGVATAVETALGRLPLPTYTTRAA